MQSPPTHSLGTLLVTLALLGIVYALPTCRTTELCGRLSNSTAYRNATRTDIVCTGERQELCEEGIECVYPTSFWLEHEADWPPEAANKHMCSHEWATLLTMQWPQPGAPLLCEALVRATVSVRLAELTLETLPPSIAYLVDLATGMADTCCGNRLENEELMHEVVRVLNDFIAGSLSMEEGGLPSCPPLAPITYVYTGNEPYWYHYLFYGEGNYRDGMLPRGYVLTGTVLTLSALLVFLAAFAPQCGCGSSPHI